MSAPNVLVLRAPGINCERETFDAFARVGGRPEFVHVKRLVSEPHLLQRAAILTFPGGFAYGDDIAAGRVLATELRTRLGDELLGFVDRGGLVLGICNGFQALVRLGLLPRLGGMLKQEVTLTYNASNHYECRWVTLKSGKSRCAFVPDGWTMRCPAAHGEGMLLTHDEHQRSVLSHEGHVVFRYVDAQGHATETYPANPNGTPDGIAGLTDITGRVLGLMPHPDRAYLPHHMPNWRRDGLGKSGDGLVLFEAMVKAAT